MQNEYESMDGLVDDIVGTANFISRIFFNKGSVLAIAAITLVIGFLFLGG
jgi:hypothetical protein